MINLVYIKQFSKCLEEWNTEVGEKRVTDLKGIVSMVAIQLGYVDYSSDEFNTNPINTLEELLVELTESTTIFEEIIVDGILFSIYSYLNNNISNREKVIKSNEFLLKNAEKLSIKDVKEMTQATITKLQAPDYIELAEKEIEIWKNVYNKYFSSKVREDLMDEKTYLASKEMQAKMSVEERRLYEETKEKLRN